MLGTNACRIFEQAPYRHLFVQIAGNVCKFAINLNETCRIHGAPDYGQVMDRSPMAGICQDPQEAGEDLSRRRF